MRIARTAIVVAALALSGPAAAHVEPSAFDAEAAIRHSQAAIGRTLGDHVFRDANGEIASFAEFRGKPVVVNLVYTACTHTCPMIVQTLARAVEAAQGALGSDRFSVVTVGFDTRNDTPARMRAYAASQGVDLPNWRFLSADRATIERLSGELGFIYFPSPKGFDHLAQTTVVDPSGRVYRQVYGADFEPPALGEPLKDLVFGRRAPITGLSDLIDRVRLFCTIYDPAEARYRFDYSVFIALAIGVVSLGGIAVVLVRSWLRTRPADGGTTRR